MKGTPRLDKGLEDVTNCALTKESAHMNAEEALAEIILEHVRPRLVEPHIYSVYSQVENVGSYDRFGSIYDVVACNRLYNRLLWGYSISDFHSLCHDALRSVSEGWVLDAGCGSLAFTARAYVRYCRRPVVLLDQSMKLLRMAKVRLTNLSGGVPPNMVFVHGDALDLPFKPKSFSSIISMNLLHVLDEVRELLVGLKRVMTDDATASFSTLIRCGRLSDNYLNMLGRAGAVVPRSADQLLAIFDEVSMPVEHRASRNMAVICHKQVSPEG
ncbi:MAG: class I SAM-dependent methyltransferase [Pseudomonadota bacterium]